MEAICVSEDEEGQVKREIELRRYAAEAKRNSVRD